MKNVQLSRRAMLTTSGASLAALMMERPVEVSASNLNKGEGAGTSYCFCLNTSTIRGQQLGLVKELEIAKQAGYDAIEPWTSSIHSYVKEGGSLKDFRHRAEDLGLTIESAIAFNQWIVDDEATRAKGMEGAKMDMDVLAQIGGKRIAAPPAGATSEPGLDLLIAAERYRALLELGDQMGVVPQVEVWGSSKNLHRLGESVFVAIESGHPKACLLPDVYHVYKGGSAFSGLKLLSSAMIQVFHINDYPADPPRETIRDGDRIMPGDGIAPLTQILRDYHSTGGRKVLSLELFNREYWQKDALETARIGLEKMKEALEKALA